MDKKHEIKKNRMVGYVIILAIALDALALVFLGFPAALFGALMFFIGYFIVPLGFMTDRKGWLDAMPDEVKSDNEV